MPIDDPDGPHLRAVPAFSVRRQWTVDNKFLTVGRLGAFDDFSGPTYVAQGGNQRVRSIAREPQRLEELSFPPVIWMGRIQQVLDDFVSLHEREMSVSQFHRLAPS
jgi:hypothetical protein